MSGLAAMSTTTLLRKEDLHASLSDPVLDTMNFLNEITFRYPDAISFAPGRPYDGFFDTEQIFTHIRRYLDHLAAHGTSPEPDPRLDVPVRSHRGADPRADRRLASRGREHRRPGRIHRGHRGLPGGHAARAACAHRRPATTCSWSPARAMWASPAPPACSTSSGRRGRARGRIPLRRPRRGDQRRASTRPPSPRLLRGARPLQPGRDHDAGGNPPRTAGPGRASRHPDPGGQPVPDGQPRAASSRR